MITKDDIERAIREPWYLLGVKFVLNGRDRDGLDCFGLCKVLYGRLGVEIGDYPVGTEDRKVNEQSLLDGLAKGWKQVSSPAPGVGVLFRVFGYGCHVGVMIDDDWFLHTMSGCAVSRERLSRAGWDRRVIAYYVQEPLIA